MHQRGYPRNCLDDAQNSLIDIEILAEVSNLRDLQVQKGREMPDCLRTLELERTTTTTADEAATQPACRDS